MQSPEFYPLADAAIITGRADLARQFLPAHPIARGSSDRRWAAEIFRRLGDPEAGIHLLAPLVRSTARRIRAATPEERAEYAACLVRLGAIPEALRELTALDIRAVPQVSLFRGLAHIHRWDYLAAIAHLRIAYRDPSLRNYSRLVAGVNLLQSYVFTENYEKAEKLGHELLQKTALIRAKFLEGNIRSLLATVYVHAGESRVKVESVVRPLTDGAPLPFPAGSYDALVLAQALALLDARTDRSGAELRRVRDDAVRYDQPEIVRECDLQLALFQNDRDLLARVYFHTPYSAYRQRMERIAARAEISLANTWLENPNGKQHWDIDREPHLKPGQAMDRLLRLLLAERYRRYSLIELATQVFPDSPLNLATLADQMHQLIGRVRRFLKASGAGVTLLTEKRRYFLQIPVGIVVRHSRTDPALTPWTAPLFRHFQNREFSALEAAEYLGMTPRNFALRSRPALAERSLLRVGRGKTTRYRIVAPTSASR